MRERRYCDDRSAHYYLSLLTHSSAATFFFPNPFEFVRLAPCMARKRTVADNSRSPIKRAIVPLCYVLVIFYLCFHAISGERGALAMFQENRKLENLKLELAAVKAERESLDRKVKRLSDDSLDLDLLDEQAKFVLGMAGKDEVVYFPESLSAAR